MMLTIVIILLAWDDEGITLKLHSHGRLLARCLARNLQWGGGVQSCETKLKQFIFGIGTFFLPEIRVKEAFTWIWSSFLPKVR